MSAAPVVSVVIPTHNRRALLRRTLDALARQTYPPANVQVVVVADGCRDDTEALLATYEAPFRLDVVVQPGRGASAARNAGAARALAPLLLFLDDDIEASPGLIAAHLAGHEREPAPSVVIGYTPPRIPPPLDTFQHGLRLWWEDLFHAMRQRGYRHTYRSLLTGNVSIPAALFERAGGFDATLACREDYELGIRLLKAGATFVFVPDAWGAHHLTMRFPDVLRRARAEGVADVALAHRHPDVLEGLRFFRETTGGARPRAARLAFAAPRLGAAFLRAAQPVLQAFDRLQLRTSWQRLAGRVQHYAYWQGAAEALGSPDALAALHAAPRPAPAADMLVVDLGADADLEGSLDAAEALLDARRPSAVLLTYGAMVVGSVPAVSGTEALRGHHLRPMLAEQFAEPFAVAVAVAAATGGPGTPGRVDAPPLTRQPSNA